MTFGEAMDAVADGRKVTKAEWSNTAIYLQLSDGFLKIFKPGPSGVIVNGLLISDGDLLGQDWMEI